MPTWGQLLKEIAQTKTPQGTPDFDAVRRKYLRLLSELTHRPAILYASAFLESKSTPPAPGDLQIHLGDMQGFMECVHGINEKSLDLIILSPGGSAEAAESIVSYLRAKFDHIRVIVPLAAMSAATMLALAADEIVIGKHSQLGPIDPQFTIATPEGPRSSPAQAILEQFERAKEECKNPAYVAAWLPILRTYAPGLIAQCVNQQQLAERMVGNWLAKYMFRDDKDGAERATTVAHWFADYGNFKSHGRPVRIEELKSLLPENRVIALESDQPLQDAVLSVHHATMHTFARTSAVKLVENHLGNTWAKLVLTQVIRSPSAEGNRQGETTSPSPEMSRQQRRAWERDQRKRQP